MLPDHQQLVEMKQKLKLAIAIIAALAGVAVLMAFMVASKPGLVTW